MLSGRDDLGESRMREICMSGSTREREAAVFGLCASHSVLSSLLYRFNRRRILSCAQGTRSALRLACRRTKFLDLAIRTIRTARVAATPPVPDQPMAEQRP